MEFRGLNQSMIAIAKDSYCVKGLTNKEIAGKFDFKEDVIRGLAKYLGWVRPGWYDKEVIRIAKMTKAMREKGGFVVDKAVEKDSKTWPEDARFDRPGMNYTFKRYF